ncbi:DUF481 domain-containing protein [Aequorivita xiaoshiensis]|uniref:DUF481 domain-containing protein n=1 Tax=Aequorivita xiaoshiensis TaxID=2874476 RepID=A0A9X1U6R2_9FLAO|nr:DUF481 domain-containing protein [Aequorivita xiaoshiensis]MCG2431472.1 DUF481 domain-containing protein [Aequorivita xiaoshiensis]
MKYILLPLFLLLSFNISAQVINAESFRRVTDTSGFSGSTSLDFALKRDVNDKLSIKNNIHVQYKMNRHLVLLKNEIEFQRIEGDKFENRGIQHLRYNYNLFPNITWEVFGQGQYNKVSKIDFRGLVGTGPRFKLTQLEDYKFYLGTLLMYEHEKRDDILNPIKKGIRGSIYFSFSLYPQDYLTVISTTYYQPMLKSITDDYRVSSQTSLLVHLFKNFSFKTTYTFNYDEIPAEGIPNSQYELTTGVVYSFD